MKEHFNEEHVMTKENVKGVKNSTKCLICDNKYVDGYVKLKDHYILLENIEIQHMEL